MRNYWLDYFYYTRSERNGVMALALITVIVWIVTIGFSHMNKRFESYDVNDFAASITDFEKSITNEHVFPELTTTEASLFTFNPNTATHEDFVQLGLSPRVATIIEHYRQKGGQFRRKEDLMKIYGFRQEDFERLKNYVEIPETGKQFFENYGARPPQLQEVKEVKLFPFDPNTATEMELLTLGLEKNIVKNILKYREKGGHFNKKEDFKKIYNLSEIDFLRLENYIQFSENQKNTHEYFSSNKQPTTQPKQKSEQSLIIDVNNSSEGEWLQLRGIGTTFARRIVEQREKLGGFASLEQLKETYGLPDSTYYQIVPFLKLSPVTRKLHINKANIEQITHPYITRKQVEVMIRYRMNHGLFKNFEDLKRTGVLPEKLLEKLKPYIDFN